MSGLIQNIIQENSNNERVGSRYDILKSYYDELGSLDNIKMSDVYVYNGHSINIGRVIINLRQEYKNGLLSEDRIEQLNNLGMKWKYDKYEWFKAYYSEFGTLSNIKSGDVYLYRGKIIQIGKLTSVLRQDYKKGRLSEEEIALFESMGIVWKYDRVEHFREYYRQVGSLKTIKRNTIFNYNGKDLKMYELLRQERLRYKNGLLDAETIKELESMGIIWEIKSFDNRIAPLRDYYQTYGTIGIIKKDETYIFNGEEVKIYVLVYMLRNEYRKNKLTKQQIKELESMGMIWKHQKINARLQPLIAYYNQYGSTADIDLDTIYEYKDNDVKVGLLVDRLKNEYRDNALSAREINILNLIGMNLDKLNNTGINK